MEVAAKLIRFFHFTIPGYWMRRYGSFQEREFYCFEKEIKR
jgi:hypothetical protein